MMALKERCYEEVEKQGKLPAKVTQRIRAQQGCENQFWPPTFNFFHCTIRRSGRTTWALDSSSQALSLGKESWG